MNCLYSGIFLLYHKSKGVCGIQPCMTSLFTILAYDPPQFLRYRGRYRNRKPNPIPTPTSESKIRRICNSQRSPPSSHSRSRWRMKEVPHFQEQTHISLDAVEPIHQGFGPVDLPPCDFQPNLARGANGHRGGICLPFAESTSAIGNGKDHLSSPLAGKVKLDFCRDAFATRWIESKGHSGDEFLRRPRRERRVNDGRGKFFLEIIIRVDPGKRKPGAEDQDQGQDDRENRLSFPQPAG